MTPRRSLREVVLTVGAAASLVLSVVQFALGLLLPARAAWQLGAAAALVALVLIGREAGPVLRRWTPVVVSSAFCLLSPLAMSDDARPTSLLLTLVSVPLINIILFFDDFRVVMATAISGTVATVLARPFLVMTDGEAVEFVVSCLIVNGLAAVCAYGYARQQAAALGHEASRTEQLQLAERRQAQAERMALVGQLAAGVAHEINNPLAFVSSNVSIVREHLLGRNVLSEEPPAQVLAEAQEGLERIRQIVADLKAFARDEADAARPVHVADVVQEALRLASVSMPAGVFVECSGLSTVPLVKASHRKLVQVVLNLLMNAADAMVQAGVKEPRVTVTVRRTSAGVAIDVADNGAGVDASVQGRLFEPFFTTKPPGKGTGLGLAMARETLRAIGGEVSLSPSLRGACFTVEIPVDRRRTPTETPAAAPSTVS